jgi:hypothetical protein
MIQDTSYVLAIAEATIQFSEESPFESERLTKADHGCPHKVCEKTNSKMSKNVAAEACVMEKVAIARV